jgi:hypothetical protein
VKSAEIKENFECNINGDAIVGLIYKQQQQRVTILIRRRKNTFLVTFLTKN